TVVTGVYALDADPPELRRRGAAAARATALASGPPDLRSEVARRGAVRAADLVALGVQVAPADGVHVLGDWLVAADRWQDWRDRLVAAVDAHVAAAPLEPGLPDDVARQRLGLPDRALLRPLVEAAGLEHRDGRVSRPGAAPVLSAAIATLEDRLAASPYDAPEQADL